MVPHLLPDNEPPNGSDADLTAAAANHGSIGVRVRSARLACGVSLRDLAAEIGVSPATLSQIENGHTGLRTDRLENIAHILGVRSSHILDGSVRPAVVSSTPPPVESDWRNYPPLDFPPILAAALDEFLSVGYHGTTMRRISARCSISVPGIYNYYPSKQSILMDILDRTMSELEWRSEAAAAQGRGAVNTFCLLVENLALFHTHRRRLGFIGASEVRALEPENRAVVAARRNRQQEMLDDYVQTAVRLGEFRTPHPDDAARAVVTMCTALPTWWQSDGPLTPEQLATEYVDYALGIMVFAARSIR